MNPRAGLTRLPFLLLLAVLALGWDLGGHRLLDPDEGRNAEVAREMAETNDYVVPHLDGLPYLDKPVVYFAAAAAVMEWLGPTETAARLPAWLATLATIALVAWFARRRWGSHAGWIAGLAVATMPLTLAYARTAIFDSTLTFFTTAAILCLVEDRPALAWAAIGAGAITKGPIAILVPLAAVLPWMLLTGRPLASAFRPRALLAFVAVALPWFIAVTHELPEFPHYAFVRETFERVTTRGFHRTGPFWYYLPILPIAAFPWTVPALARLGGGRARWAWLARRVNPNASEPILLASWILVPLLFFSLNQSKLPQYVLPITPAFALAAARNLTRDGVAVGWKSYGAIAVALGLTLLTFTIWLPAPMSLTPAQRTAIPSVARVLGVALFASAALLAWAVRRGSLATGAAAYALVILAVPLAGGRLIRAVGQDRSAAALADAVRGRGAVLLIRAYPTSLPFYLRHTVPIATATARELTSNYIADYAARFRDWPGSPLLPADSWVDVLERCTEPTVFITRAVDADVRARLADLPLLYDDGRYEAFGPCRRSP